MSDPELTHDQKTQRLIWGALVALVTIGLAASTALLVDYLRPLPLFCSETGGCAELRRSVYAQVFGAPTPLFGVIGYGALGVLTLLRGDLPRFFQLVAAMFGALAAAYLLFLQVSLSTFCGYCMTVDVVTIIVLSIVLMRVRTEADAESWQATLGGGAVIALGAAVPLLSHVLVRTQVPELVSEEMKKTPHGEVTIVDFVDFECPFCRQTASDFAPTLGKYKGKFRLVRKEVPLTKIHPHALTAARAECCAELMGQADPMADELMSMPIEDLTDDGCTKAAGRFGINEQAFRACLSDPRTMQRIDADGADFQSIHGKSLPLIWINDQVIEGAQGPDKLREAMEKALTEVGS
jgi:uncharacterized membrane protein/predicted DsbA family dithiol-disulfide isomerase